MAAKSNGGTVKSRSVAGKVGKGNAESKRKGQAASKTQGGATIERANSRFPKTHSPQNVAERPIEARVPQQTVTYRLLYPREHRRRHTFD